MTRAHRAAMFLCSVLILGASTPSMSQAPAQAPGARGGGRGPAAPPVVSPDVTADRRIVFRLSAPQAQAVRLTASDIPGIGQGGQLTKGENGVWETTVGPVPAGSYRYTFNVDGVATIDPRNPATSESQNNVWSLVNVAGSFADTKNVPHGSIAEVTYYSTALGAFRRMHIYTPPGYEAGSRRYPVFYLLHGAGDSDDSWSTVGRAGFILDNLIAEKKARPMIMVMPAGHTRPPAPGSPAAAPGADAFVSDFVTDVMPYVQKSYRISTDRASTAIAGLSMGGSQTLNIAIPNLEKFAYIGVYSSGLLGAFPNQGRRGAAPGAAPAPAPAPAPAAASGATEWETRNASKLADANLKKGLKLFWFSTGKEDFLLGTTTASVDLFRKHGFNVVYQESGGGHTWLNWRDYLNAFAPQLFQ